MRTKSTIGVSAVVFVGCALLVAACDDGTVSDPTTSNAGSAGVGGHVGTGGHNAVGGSTNTGGLSATGGATLIGGAGGTGGAAGAVNNCTKLPMNQLLTDFSPATIKGVSDGTSWSMAKTSFWGSSTSLTGGDAFYQGQSASAPTVKLQGETLTITTSVAPGDYAGYMFNFGPACTNASATHGLKFDVLPNSTLGNATLKVQMQQKSDYPSTANPTTRPGDCVPSSKESQYQDCLSPVTTVVSSGSTLSSGTVELPWTLFADGKPVSNVDPGQLMAIQWQFECPSSGGTVALADIVSVGGGDAGGSSGAGTAGGGAGGVSSGGTGGASGGSSGSSGDSSGGTAGSSAGAGGSSAGTGGSSGSSGSAGLSAGGADSGGSGGTAGANTAGSGGTGGSSGGAGGGSSTPSPCVVSIVIDNVTFY